MMKRNRLIRILLLEDVASDAELARLTLERAGLNIEICLVDDEAGFRARLEIPDAQDIILSDFALPTFDGLSALMLRTMLVPHLPFIFVTGSLGEERVVEMLHIGASDYVLKDNLARLPLAVLRALAEADAERIRDQMQQQLSQEQHLLGAVLATSGALIVLIDRVGNILRLNPAAAEVLGMEQAGVEGAAFAELFSLESERDNLAAMLSSLASNEVKQHIFWRSTVGLRSILWSAGLLPAAVDSNEFAVISGLDVTAQEEAEQQAYYLRNFDAFTGLPNRELLLLRLARLQHQAHEGLALVMVGVARLQDVRDSLGEDAANQMLREVTHRLLSWHLPGDCLARIGDDSFALVLEAEDIAALTPLLQDMLAMLHQPFQINDRAFFLSAYLGVAPNLHLISPESALQAATTALHHAMQQMGESYQFYQPLLSNEARARLELEGELHQALRDENQLILHYQPQVDMRTGLIVGVEALMRWRHPRLGLVAPGRFIPLAESCGLIGALGEYALRLSCHQAAAWQRAGLAPVPVAVNLSAQQWSQPGLTEIIRQALQDSGLAPQWLELELTESASMHDPDATLNTMRQLHEMGVQISIDDFGTGFCNLGYLKRFPVDKLKIDQSFVREITTQPDDLVISRLVVAMGHLLQLRVVAEGVETEGQLILLSEAGCDILQGYYFSRPVEADDCALLLASETRLPEPKRHYAHHLLLWIDTHGPASEVSSDWLNQTDYHVLRVDNIKQGFETLATHEVGIVILDPAQDELASIELMRHIAKMYPNTLRILLRCAADSSVPDEIGLMILPYPQTPGSLLTAVGAGFARYDSEHLLR